MSQEFDGSFYQSLFPTLSNADESAVREHWQTVGRPKNIPGSRDGLLRQVGFKNFAWADEVFDHRAYLRLNPDLDEARVGNEAKALLHFVVTGLAQGRPMSETIEFDPRFYGEYVGDRTGSPVSKLYHHWLDIGYPNGYPSSEQVFMAGLGLNSFALPNDFTFDRYVAANPDCGHLPSRWHAFEHFATAGAFEGRDCGFSGAEAAGLLAQIGLSCRRRSENSRAITAYQRSIVIDGSVGWVFEDIGNAHMDQGQHHYASDAYRRALALGSVSLWCAVNLIRSLLAQGRNDEAYTVAVAERDRLTGWFTGQQVLEEALSARFGSLMSRARVASIDQDRETALALAQEAAEITRTSLSPAPNIKRREDGEPLKVVALVNDGLQQCFHYRVLQKAQQLDRVATVDFAYFTDADMGGFRAALLDADAALFYRVAALPHISAAIGYACSLDIPTIYEIDDLIFEAEHYPPTLQSYGGLVDRHEYSGLLTGVPLFRAAATMCDYAIASTPSLARHLEPLVKRRECYVHRNALGGSHVQIGSRKRRGDGDGEGGDRISIFYGSGTKAHNADFENLAAPALLKLLKAHRSVELVIVGFLTLPKSFEAVADRIRQFKVLKGAESYWRLLRESDINLAVLEPGVMNDCKSEIKWLEAAALGVPSVVSDTATYLEILTDGETAMIAKDSDDWFEKLDRLARSGELRRTIAGKARAFALRSYSLSQKASELSNWLDAKIAEHHGRSSHGEEPMRKRKKVLIVNVFFPPQSIGGATRVVRDNVDIMIDRYGEELDLSVFTTYDGHPQPYQVDRYGYRGIPVTRVSTPQELDMDWRVANPAVGAIFAEYLERSKPDLVHFHCVQRLTNSVVKATHEAGIPYVVTVHDGWWISDFQFLVDHEDQAKLPTAGDPKKAIDPARSIEASLERLLDLKDSLDEAEEVLAVSDSFAKIYRSAGIHHTKALPNGLSRITPLAKRFSKTGAVRLAHIGGMATHKGFHLVRRALTAGRFPNLELTMVDHAMFHGSVRHEQWGATKVTICGKVPQEKIAELYANHDVLLAPSTWPESYGLVVREALASGLWTVVSNLGALKEPVEENVNGFIVDTSRSNPLYPVFEAMNADPSRFLSAPPELNRWTTPEDQVARLVDIYRGIMVDAPIRLQA